MLRLLLILSLTALVVIVSGSAELIIQFPMSNMYDYYYSEEYPNAKITTRPYQDVVTIISTCKIGDKCPFTITFGLSEEDIFAINFYKSQRYEDQLREILEKTSSFISVGSINVNIKKSKVINHCGVEDKFVIVVIKPLPKVDLDNIASYEEYRVVRHTPIKWIIENIHLYGADPKLMLGSSTGGTCINVLKKELAHNYILDLSDMPKL